MKKEDDEGVISWRSLCVFIMKVCVCDPKLE